MRPLDRRPAPGIRVDVISQGGLVTGIRLDIRHNDVLIPARGRSQLALRIALQYPKTRITFAPNRRLKRRTFSIAHARVPAECRKPGKIPQRGLHELVKLVPLDRAGSHEETLDGVQKLQVAADTGLQVSRHGVGALVKRDAQAVLLPQVVRWNAEHVGDRYAMLLRQSASGGDAVLAARLEALARAGGLPATLRELGVDRDKLPALAADAAAQWTGTFNPRPFDAAGALEIYEQAY